MSATSDFYFARADESAQAARATDLPNVKARCLRAEQAWRTMAERLLQADQAKQRQAVEKAMLAGPDE